MSKLPINPAFESFSTSGNHPQIWSDMQSKVVEDGTSFVKIDIEFGQRKAFNADLLTSELPINPGFSASSVCERSLEC